MQFDIKLFSVWKFVPLAVIMTMILFITVLHLTNGAPIAFFILSFPLLFGSMILSALVCSRTKRVSIENGVLSVNGSYNIQIDQIEWYYAGKNFLFDGIRIKTKQNKNFFFTTDNLFYKNSNFKIFKNILITKSLDHPIPQKTERQLSIEEGPSRVGATIFLVVVIILHAISFFTSLKIAPIKLFYWSMIALGTFISTRK